MSDAIHHLPAYSVADAARYLSIPAATVGTWVKGRNYNTQEGSQFSKPLILRPIGSSLLSLTNLVEVHVLRIIRKVHGVRLDKVRCALDYLEQKLNVSHPLTTVRFKTDGVDLFVDSINRLVNASRSGELAIRSALEGLLTQVEYNLEEAIRFYPVPNAKVIAIDPSVSFGQPMVVGTGIPTSAIASLYNAGDEIEDIAYEYDCNIEQIKSAIQFEASLLAA
jgi:uncharacterized protein (DUF433 family)